MIRYNEIKGDEIINAQGKVGKIYLGHFVLKPASPDEPAIMTGAPNGHYKPHEKERVKSKSKKPKSLKIKK